MNSKQKGDLAELKVATRLTELGYTVSFPFGDRSAYDLILDNGEHLLRIQIKHGRIRNGIVKFKTTSTTTKNGKALTVKCAPKVDGIISYVPENNSYYMICGDDMNKNEISLRITPPHNHQTKNIFWAKDFVLK